MKWEATKVKTNCSSGKLRLKCSAIFFNSSTDKTAYKQEIIRDNTGCSFDSVTVIDRIWRLHWLVTSIISQLYQPHCKDSKFRRFPLNFTRRHATRRVQPEYLHQMPPTIHRAFCCLNDLVFILHLLKLEKLWTLHRESSIFRRSAMRVPQRNGKRTAFGYGLRSS